MSRTLRRPALASCTVLACVTRSRASPAPSSRRPRYSSAPSLLWRRLHSSARGIHYSGPRAPCASTTVALPRPRTPKPRPPANSGGCSSVPSGPRFDLRVSASLPSRGIEVRPRPCAEVRRRNLPDGRRGPLLRVDMWSAHPRRCVNNKRTLFPTLGARIGCWKRSLVAGCSPTTVLGHRLRRGSGTQPLGWMAAASRPSRFARSGTLGKGGAALRLLSRLRIGSVEFMQSRYARHPPSRRCCGILHSSRDTDHYGEEIILIVRRRVP